MRDRVCDIAAWLFEPQEPPGSAWGTITWWEARRIPFNLVIGAYGLLCLALFLWGLSTSGRLGPGEDAVEPMALLGAPIAINVLYTLGWLVEIPVRVMMPATSDRLGPILLKLGFVLGLALSTLPAAFWVGYRLLQLVGAVR